MKGSINGRLVEDDRAGLLSPLDRGFLYGDGLFETLRVRRGRIEFLPEHAARLLRSARELAVPYPWDAARTGAAIEEVVKANGGGDLALRITVTRGIGGDRVRIEGCRQASIAITAAPFAGYPDRLRIEGFRLATCPFPRNERSPLARHKTTSFLETVLAREAAQRAGADEALLLNTAGRVAEAGVANLFLVRNGTLVTPPIEEGALPGIVRGALIHAAPSLGLPVGEEPVLPEDLLAASEVLVTNSLLGVAPVRAIDGLPLPVPAEGGWGKRIQLRIEQLAGGENPPA